MTRIRTALFGLLLVLSACGPQIYKSNQLASAVQQHKTVAILPAEVTMRLRPNEMKNMSQGSMTNLQERTGLDIQDRMYSWLLRRSDRFHYSVSFQDINKTNSLLRDAGITAATLASQDRKELARILGVDAVMQNRSYMDKPMSDGAALAVGVLFGAWTSTNAVQTTINIHDGSSGSLLWKYDYEAQGSVGSNAESLVNGLMRNATKHFPYKEKS